MRIRDNHALPIFLLYIITSFVFLGVCSVLYYNIAKQDLIKDIQKDIFSAAREIDFAIKSGRLNELDLDDIDDDLEIKIVPLESKKVEREFLQPLKKQSKKSDFSDRFKVKDGEVTFKTIMHTRQNESRYEVFFKSKEYGEEIREIITQIAVFAIISVILFLFVSYFIIRLSFRPLYKQINSLNSFITDATHEINTPLSVILMSIEMFEANPKKYLANIKTASKTISNLYDDLVNLNLRNAPNELKSGEIKALIEERISYFSIMLNDKNLQILSNLNEANLQTDENKFRKIFDNILSNAIKYCDENSEINV
ncbi:MAG: HAMP domain-containing histidine kinase, partial [Campylobacter sp.]|nr:HAMP domain-containing histidine kinase [Campylobacter sp.]